MLPNSPGARTAPRRGSVTRVTSRRGLGRGDRVTPGPERCHDGDV
jgi:hypothetical protein